ncbi:TPA: Tctex1 domain-containing protein 2 [Trebouxia sp. C0004]
MAANETSMLAATYDVEPAGGNRFRQSQAQDILAAVLKEKLLGATYHAENSSAWAREIADEVKGRLKAQEKWTRYKYVVQVFIGEQRGEAVRMGCRCFWDPKTDDYAQQVFSNETLFCVASAYGVYLY